MTMMNDTHATPTHATPARHSPDPAHVERAIGKRSFATLATVSPKGRPHVAGVMYELVAGRMYVNTQRTTRKARNVAANPHVAVAIPVRRVPVGPPSLVHFQATAEVLAIDDPHVLELLDAGELTAITSHGELGLPDDCFVRIALPARLHTYGLGMSLRELIRNPLDAAGAVVLSEPPAG